MKFKILLMQYFTYRGTCSFQQGIAKFLSGWSGMISTLLSLMEHGSLTRNLGLQITVVFKLTKDGDTCVSQCGKKQMLHVRSEGPSPTPSPGTISCLSFNMSLTSLHLSSTIYNTYGTRTLSTSIAIICMPRIL